MSDIMQKRSFCDDGSIELFGILHIFKVFLPWNRSLYISRLVFSGVNFSGVINEVSSLYERKNISSI